MTLRGRRMPRRFIQLLIGLFIFGLGIAFILRSTLGSAPWDVLGQGVALHLPLSFGTITVIISIAVLLLWIPLRERPGIATLCNAFLIGPSADVGLWILPEPEDLVLRIVFVVFGVLLVGTASGMYLGTHLGAGPRDGLMTGIHRRTGWRIWIVRTGLEVIVLVIGWILGGVVGAGTVLFAVAIGPLCQVFMRVFDIAVPQREALSATVEANPAAGLLTFDEDEQHPQGPERELHEKG